MSEHYMYQLHYTIPIQFTATDPISTKPGVGVSPHESLRHWSAPLWQKGALADTHEWLRKSELDAQKSLTPAKKEQMLCLGTALSCFSTINQIVAQGMVGLNIDCLLKGMLCSWQLFLLQNMSKRDEPPYGSVWCQSLAGGGMVRGWELQTEGKSVLKSVLIKRYFGTSSPAAPGTD